MSGPVRAVLLDAVGTLIEARPPVAEVYRQTALDCCGLDLQLADVQRRLHRAMSEVSSSLLPDLRTSEQAEYEYWRAVVAATLPELHHQTDHLLRILWDHFADPDHWRVIADVADSWQLLAPLGCRVGIASNFDRRLEAICRQLAPLDQAHAVFTSGQLGFRKPHPGFFLAIQQAWAIEPQSCVLIGDQLDSDIAGARQAGWRAVWLDRTRSASGDVGGGANSRDPKEGSTIAWADSLGEALARVAQWCS